MIKMIESLRKGAFLLGLNAHFDKLSERCSVQQRIVA
jgi:hypothetical protein